MYKTSVKLNIENNTMTVTVIKLVNWTTQGIQ